MLDSFKKTRDKTFDFQDGGSWAKTVMVFAKLIYDCDYRPIAKTIAPNAYCVYNENRSKYYYDFDPLHNKYDGARCPVTKDVISVIMWDT